MARHPTAIWISLYCKSEAPVAINKTPPTKLMMNSSLEVPAPSKYVTIMAGTIIANPTQHPIPRYAALLLPHPIG